jgi:hypothetical protein
MQRQNPSPARLGEANGAAFARADAVRKGDGSIQAERGHFCRGGTPAYGLVFGCTTQKWRRAMADTEPRPQGSGVRSVAA